MLTPAWRWRRRGLRRRPLWQGVRVERWVV